MNYKQLQATLKTIRDWDDERLPVTCKLNAKTEVLKAAFVTLVQQCEWYCTEYEGASCGLETHENVLRGYQETQQATVTTVQVQTPSEAPKASLKSRFLTAVNLAPKAPLTRDDDPTLQVKALPIKQPSKAVKAKRDRELEYAKMRREQLVVRQERIERREVSLQSDSQKRKQAILDKEVRQEQMQMYRINQTPIMAAKKSNVTIH